VGRLSIAPEPITLLGFDVKVIYHDRSSAVRLRSSS